MRNILSPLLAGGAVISCAGFDALLFWDILYRTDELVTWYGSATYMLSPVFVDIQNALRQVLRGTNNASCYSARMCQSK